MDYLSFNHTGNIIIQINTEIQLETDRLRKTLDLDGKFRGRCESPQGSIRYIVLSKHRRLQYQEGSNNAYLLLLWSLYYSMVVRHGLSARSSRKILIDDTLLFSKQHAKSTGNSVWHARVDNQPSSLTWYNNSVCRVRWYRDQRSHTCSR